MFGKDPFHKPAISGDDLGRNRTLGLKALDTIKVPVPPYKAQLWFDQLYDKAEELRKKQEDVEEELEALLLSVLRKAFRGEL